MSDDQNPKILKFSDAQNSAPQEPIDLDKLEQMVNAAIDVCQEGDFEQAVEMWTKILDIPNLPSAARVPARFNRAISRGAVGDHDGEIEDYSAILEMPEATGEDKAMACINRGQARGEAGDIEGEIADCTMVIENPDTPAEQIAAAYFNRGLAKGALDDSEGEIQDYNTVLTMPAATVEQKVDSYFNRGSEKARSGDFEGALTDYQAVIDMPDAPAEQETLAHSEQGWILYNMARFDESIEATRRAVALAPDEPMPHNHLALALMASGQGQDGLEEIDTLLAVAYDPYELEETTVGDLVDAINKHPDKPEFKTALEKVVTTIVSLKEQIENEGEFEDEPEDEHEQGCGCGCKDDK
jgi:tetratricopeptide (TPR) repeat protein